MTERSRFETAKRIGRITGVGMLAVGAILGIPGLIIGGVIDFGISDPNLKAVEQTWKQYKDKKKKNKS